MSAAPTGAGKEGGSILLLADGGQEMQMVAGGNGLSSASKYGLGGWAGAGLGWAGSRMLDANLGL